MTDRWDLAREMAAYSRWALLFSCRQAGAFFGFFFLVEKPGSPGFSLVFGVFLRALFPDFSTFYPHFLFFMAFKTESNGFIMGFSPVLILFLSGDLPRRTQIYPLPFS